MSAWLGLLGFCTAAPAALQAQINELVSVNFRATRTAANAASQGAAVSADGRFVAFFSNATDLVFPNDNRPFRDVFVRDRLSQTTERVSVAIGGGEPNGNSEPDDLTSPAISADGCAVAFSSEASNLVPDDDNGAAQDVFVRDRCASTTERIGRGINPDVSADGRYVVWQALDGIRLFDRQTRESRVVSDGTGSSGFALTPSISGNGRVVAFAFRGPGAQQIFIRDLETDLTDLVSVNNAGAAGNLDSFCPDLDFDGDTVAFKSEAFNLVAGDVNQRADVFVRDRARNTTERVSVDTFGNAAQDNSTHPSISADGRYVAFPSFDNFFDPNDDNLQSDIFVFDRTSRQIRRVSVEIGDRASEAGVTESAPSISADGRWIGFASASVELVPNNDPNNTFDVFLGCNPLIPPCPIDTGPTPTPTPPTPCDSQDDCPDPLVCIDNICVEPPPCDSQDDCPDPLVCIDNICIEPPPCDDDGDCPPPLVCDEANMVCVLPTATPTPSRTAVATTAVPATATPTSTTAPTATPPPPTSTRAPTATTARKRGGGGGGCSIDSGESSAFGAVLLVLPAFARWRRRRRACSVGREARLERGSRTRRGASVGPCSGIAVDDQPVRRVVG